VEANDWIKKGTTMNFWQYPPQLPSKEEVEEFKDGLIETIPAKLDELLYRREEVYQATKKKAERIRDLDKTSKMFHTALLAEEYREVLVIDKWIKYWFFIQRIIEKRPEPLIDTGITDLQIAQAKAVPFELHFPTKLKKNRKYLIGLCPIHLEKTPSFTIYLESNTGHCFGCSWSGDIIEFLRDNYHLTFKQAIERLL
jgi:hypothetical protein